MGRTGCIRRSSRSRSFRQPPLGFKWFCRLMFILHPLSSACLDKPHPGFFH
jgi:hypothetical protein